MDYNSLRKVRRERQRLDKEVGEHTFNSAGWTEDFYLAQCRELHFLKSREELLSRRDKRLRQKNETEEDRVEVRMLIRGE